VDISKIGLAFRKQKLLTLFGLLVAVAAAVLSGYRVTDGGHLQARTESTYISTERILVQNISMFRSQQTHAVGEVSVRDRTVPQNSTINGANAAQLTAAYAYVLTGDDIRQRVSRSLGVDPSLYTLTAARRSSNPDDVENLGVTASSDIPVLEVTVTAHDPVLAERAASIAGGEFVAFVGEQQAAANIPQDERVTVSVLNVASAAVETGRNPLFTEAIVFVGVFAVFSMVIFSRANARANARARQEQEAQATREEGERFREDPVDVRDVSREGVLGGERPIDGAVASPEPG
jgi:hypothetical protein